MSSYIPCACPEQAIEQSGARAPKGNPGTARDFTTRQIPSGSALLSAGFGVGPAVIR